VSTPKDKKNMLVIKSETITGKRLYNQAQVAIKKAKISQNEFCDLCGLSVMQLTRYRDGVKPGNDGILKFAKGMKSLGWNISVEV
jgi:transcriptional regulator with XRE-family HTH domain